MEPLVEGTKLDADKALLALGSFGGYQLRIFILSSCVSIFTGAQMFASVFLSAQPPYNCSYDSFTLENVTQLCQCNATEFDPSFGNTIVSEWNLICGRKYLSDFSSSGFFLGFLIGSALGPMASDRWGRRWSLLVSLFAMAMVCSLLAASPTFWVFCLLRVLIGFWAAGAGVTAFVAASEVTEPKHRPFVPSSAGMAWMVGYCSVALIAWVLPDWRLMALGVGLPCWVTLSYYWFVPESLHWYVAHDKIDEAKRWITDAAKFNKVNVDWENCYGPKKADQSKKKVEFLEAVKSPTLILYTVVQVYIWFANSVIYYGLSLFATQLAGNRYVNHVLSGLVEIPAYCGLYLFFKCMGRKKTMFMFHLCAAVALGTLPFLDENSVLRISVWLLGKSCVTLTFMGAWLYSAETFPTTVRSSAVGICNISARVGGILAPFVGALADFGQSIPPFIFGSMSLVAALIVILLPETNNRKLPDDLDDI